MLFVLSWSTQRDNHFVCSSWGPQPLILEKLKISMQHTINQLLVLLQRSTVSTRRQTTQKSFSVKRNSKFVSKHRLTSSKWIVHLIISKTKIKCVAWAARLCDKEVFVLPWVFGLDWVCPSMCNLRKNPCMNSFERVATQLPKNGRCLPVCGPKQLIAPVWPSTKLDPDVDWNSLCMNNMAECQPMSCFSLLGPVDWSFADPDDSPS